MQSGLRVGDLLAQIRSKATLLTIGDEVAVEDAGNNQGLFALAAQAAADEAMDW